MKIFQVTNASAEGDQRNPIHAPTRGGAMTLAKTRAANGTPAQVATVELPRITQEFVCGLLNMVAVNGVVGDYSEEIVETVVCVLRGVGEASEDGKFERVQIERFETVEL